ncbi:MAG: adenosylcobinamide amidohydrolase [Cetobacterium sp.]|uniref:adenosylcobinamide amidohydrolase n=1 Tax=Cetobacterium sp. TaxID=2071632 RepID=UPI002FC8BC9C
MLIDTLKNGDRVYRYNKSIIVEFKGKRGTLSTGAINSGYSESLKYIFNHDAKSSPGMGCKLKAPTYTEHMEIIAEELGLNPIYASGIGTAADMENVSIVTKSHGELHVTALITGGVETNGGRVGDPASFVEENSQIEVLKPGTINILLMIDGHLNPGTLARTIITATEAKTATIQELLVGSNYSTGLATGSGTDGIITYCNLESSRKYNNAGKHSKLGELIGVAVKEALKKALNMQSDLNEETQKSIFKRAKRYGITSESTWNKYIGTEQENKITKLEYMDKILKIERDERLVLYTSLLLHLFDQLKWGLLSLESVLEGGESLLKEMFFDENLKLDNVNLDEELISQIILKIQIGLNNLIGDDFNV